MCGGYTCLKNSLTALNVIYILVAFILIGVAGYGKAASIVSSVAIAGGIITCGVILLLIAILGLFGAVKHNQVLLFFYMVNLFLLFIIQFGVAIGCLAVPKEKQDFLVVQGWNSSSDDTRLEAQSLFGCCGFQSYKDEHPSCLSIRQCCPENSAPNCCRDNGTCLCPPCRSQLDAHLAYGLKISGGIGLFFSFTEFIGVWLTFRYRNHKDPRANPSAFL